MKTKVKSITNEKIDIEGLLREAHNEQSGAVVLFCGDISNHNDGQEVIYL